MFLDSISFKCRDIYILYYIYICILYIHIYSIYINHIFYLPTIIQKLGSAFWDLGTTRVTGLPFLGEVQRSHIVAGGLSEARTGGVTHGVGMVIFDDICGTNWGDNFLGDLSLWC